MERAVLVKKAVGSILLALLLVPTLLVRRPGMPPLLAVMFTPPFIFFTAPYLVVCLYLLFSRKARKADIAAILTGFVLLLPPQVLNLPTPGFLLVYSLRPQLLPTAWPTTTPENATLEVKVLGPGGQPVVGLEVDLWTGGAPPGPPDVGFASTDESGIATFRVPLGDYKVGFNLNNFPEQFVCPPWTPVTVSEGRTAVKVIELGRKAG